jgi:uncharacterized protein YbaR (Trm112 family)
LVTTHHGVDVLHLQAFLDQLTCRFNQRLYPINATWLVTTHHGVDVLHLQAFLDQLTCRFNQRLYPINAFRSLLGIGGEVRAPPYAGLYSGNWTHATGGGCMG